MANPVAKLVRRAKSNFFWAFVFLDRSRRDAIFTTYAFARHTDDIVDDAPSPEVARNDLREWCRELDACYEGAATHPITRALQDTIDRFPIPKVYFQRLVEGVEMDLSNDRYATFEHLYAYCYRVASIVGLICIEIFGYRSQLARDYAQRLGIALQLTNILRDVGEDASRGRIYLPQNEINRFGYTEEELLQGIENKGVSGADAVPGTKGPTLLSRSPARTDTHRSTGYVRSRNHGTHLLSTSRAHRSRRLQGVRPARHRAHFSQDRDRPEALRGEQGQTVRVTVVGGGFAGISTAVELSRRGTKVTLVESRKRLGGRAYSFRDQVTGTVVDNGQHLLMRCCSATLELLEHLGSVDRVTFQNQLDLTFSDRSGTTHLRASRRLPGRLGLLAGLIRFGGIPWYEALAVPRITRSLEQLPGNRESVEAWLIRAKQPPALRDRFWTPLCVSVMNQHPRDASARLLAAVLKEAFGQSARGGDMGWATSGLSDLHDPVQSYLTSRAGEVKLSTMVRAVHPGQTHTTETKSGRQH